MNDFFTPHRSRPLACWRCWPLCRSLAQGSSLALVLLAAACGGDSESAPPGGDTEREATVPANRQTLPTETASATDTSPSKVSGSGALDIIVAPGADGSLPSDLFVGCEFGPVFQVSDLETIVPLEEGDPGGVAEAIESFLGGGEGAFWPQGDWQILRQTADEMLLVHEGTDGVAFMTVERTGDAWRWSGSQRGEGCPLHYVTPEGLNAVDWRLDPDSAPGAGDTTLAVLVTERECVSGQELGNRLLGPQVVVTDAAVRIAFAAEPPPGDSFDCPGNPEASATVELPGPLGEREIIEGLAIGVDLEDFLD
jgi:hypothetical protein